MTIKEFNSTDLATLQQQFDAKLSGIIVEDTKYLENIEKWIKQYNTETHIIMDRPDKTIIKEDKSQDTVAQARLAIPFQKRIVNSAVAFLFGKPVILSSTDGQEGNDKLLADLKKVWKDAKLDPHTKNLARKLFSEARAAELFYVRGVTSVVMGEDGNPVMEDGKEKTEVNDKKVKVITLCKSNGDDIYPVWDEFGDMTGFVRKYELEELEGGKITNVQKVEVYTAEWNYFARKGKAAWEVVKTQNLIGKIPVVYYEQPDVEWHDVQSLIDRIEDMISKNADTNDYFSSPAVVSRGKLISSPEKGEVGKFYELEPVSSEGTIEFGGVEYLTWDRAPESLKVEYEMLKDLIHSMTQTPDLSFNNVKGVSDLSGIALKFMFMDALLKAMDKQEVFGEGLDRRVSILESMMANILQVGSSGITDLDVNIEFQESLPENENETVEMLVNATGGSSIMSTATAVKKNPLVDNPSDEVEAVEKEAEKLNQIPESYGSPKT